MSSRIRSNLPIVLAAIAALLLAAGDAAAQIQQNQKLQVQAFIGELCTVTNASLDFGSAVDPDTNTNTEGEMEINCATETTFDIQLDGGLNFSPSIGARAMTGGGSNLLYLIYKDAARSVLWGANESVPATIDGTGSVTIYGQVPSQPNGHASGLHTDEVTITLNF
jgi:spore coat protein U-like protein